MIKYFCWILLAFFSGAEQLANAQSGLISGPMLGYVEMREACIWLQSDKAIEGKLRYMSEHDSVWQEQEFNTSNNPALTAHIVLSNLEPGTTYRYKLYEQSNISESSATSTGQLKELSSDIYSFKTQALWQYRTEPPEFTAAIGSCSFINEEKYDRPGNGYGGGEQIFESIAAKNPDLMVWLGDNTYFREVDWNTLSGMIHRYSHTRSIHQLQKLLANSANYAIWDDHDFGPNDSDGSFIHKDLSEQCFEMFWANPSVGLPGKGGITTQFTWGDIDFFMLDNRYFRTKPNLKGVEPTILGEDQIQWLTQALAYSKAPFKMICMGGQFLNPVAKYENYANYSEERERIIRLISENNISGVVFLTGDRHCTELSQLTTSGGNVIYDLTISPLTSSAYDNAKEENTLRVEGTLVPQRNFATLTYSGKRNSRVLTITCFDGSGQMLWQQKIEE